jgi:hypothetical protein
MTDSRAQVPRFLRPLFLIVDLGFIAYWAITLAGVVPEEYLFKDYDNPILAAWNWSFWTLRGDFDPAWWLPNLFLLLYPLCFLPKLMRTA